MSKTAMIEDSVYLIDTRFWTIGVAAYLVGEGKSALIETGSAKSYKNVLYELKQVGANLDQIICVAATHIYLDHAGATGYLVRELPNARVYVHPRGLKHLADSSRLMESARKAAPESLEEFGEIIPVDCSRLVEATNGLRIELGRNALTILESLGHARHHIVLYKNRLRALFAGDAVGMYTPEADALIPSTPPPNFDLEKSVSTAGRIASLNPEIICYTHYGFSRDVDEMLRRFKEVLREWDDLIKPVWESTQSLEKAVDVVVSHYSSESERVNEYRSSWDLRAETELNVSGYFHYYERMEQASQR